METFSLMLLVATLLCGLVAGFLFAFAVVVMPGLRALTPAEYLRGFQAMDKVIQDNSPPFVLVWAGSVLAVLVAAGTGAGRLQGVDLVLLLCATGVYLLGVQLPTFLFNIPLNNQLKHLVVRDMESDAQTALRDAFESRWVRSNSVRTLLSCAVVVLLLIVLQRL